MLSLAATLGLNRGKKLEIFGRSITLRGLGEFVENVPAGPYSEETFSAFQRLVRPDSICLDIGAYIGLTAMALATLAPRGRIVAIEASYQNFDFLRGNVEANRFSNITPLRHLVGADGAEKVHMYNPHQPGSSPSTEPEREAGISKFGLDRRADRA